MVMGVSHLWYCMCKGAMVFASGTFLGIIMIPRCSLRSLICLAIPLKILMTSRCICILFGFGNPFLDPKL